MTDRPTYCGRVAIVGAPNVGKSSLLNQLAGRALSQVTFKPQTTRARVAAVVTEGNRQLILVDTPGFQTRHRHLLDQMLTRSAGRALAQASLALLVMQVSRWTEAEARILDGIRQEELPCILCLNKIDLVPDKTALLDMLKVSAERFDFLEIFPVSAHAGTNMDQLRRALFNHLPEATFEFDENQEPLDDQDFIVEETVRKHLLLGLQQEVPHQVYAAVEETERRGSVLHLKVRIGVASERFKPIVIGKAGAKLKAIGSAARKELEHRLRCRIMMSLWVSAEDEWYNDASKLRQLRIE